MSEDSRSPAPPSEEMDQSPAEQETTDDKQQLPDENPAVETRPKRSHSDDEEDAKSSDVPDAKRPKGEEESEEPKPEDASAAPVNDKPSPAPPSKEEEEEEEENSVLNLSKKDVEPKRDSSPAVTEKSPDAKASPSAGDSDKENMADAPMDLSKGGSKVTDDVITVSEGEDDNSAGTKTPMVNGLDSQLPKGSLKRLRDELRNEEAKLVLLKKIRQSQIMQHMQESAAGSGSGSNRNVVPGSGQSAARPSNNSQPPPLVRGGQPQPSHRPTQSVPPQMQRAPPQAQPSSGQHQRSSSSSKGPPPLIMAPRNTPVNSHQGGSSSQRSSSNSVQSQRSGGPPNLIPGYQRSNQSGSSRESQAAPAQPEQTPAQRQAAAKLALRKQLEKTLLQIPPPKPPAPEMNFIPSLAGAEFMMLVGLEEVVKFIVEHDKSKENKTPEVKYVFNPFVCVQCGSDFTPVWKRDKPGSKNVICEQCVTSNQKKALKQEHTNRLKSAFVKALQQEQEIEQRMQSAPSGSSGTSGSSSSTSGSSSSSSSLPVSDRASSSSHQSHHSSAHHGSSHSSHHSSSSSAPMNLSKASSEQLRQHQNLLQAHAQLRGASHLGAAAAMGLHPRMLYPFQQPTAGSSSSAKSAELQRQYLLDMIPRSMPGSTVLWRT